MMLKPQRTPNVRKWRETPNWKYSGNSLHFWVFVVRYAFRSLTRVVRFESNNITVFGRPITKQYFETWLCFRKHLRIYLVSIRVFEKNNDSWSLVQCQAADSKRSQKERQTHVHTFYIPNFSNFSVWSWGGKLMKTFLRKSLRLLISH